MTSEGSGARPDILTVDDATLRRHLDDAEVPALLMTVAHLVGDPAVLRDDLRAPGWLLAPQGGLSPGRQAEVRHMAWEALRRWRVGAASATPDPPDGELLHAVTSWAMGSDTSELSGLLAEELAGPVLDPKAPTWSGSELAPGRRFTVAIVGAGFSGLLAGHRLAQAGVPHVIFEKNADVGGTWFDNTYPGCRTDVASHLYNYSFWPRPDWPEHFCRAEVVLDYLREFAAATGVRDHIRFGTEVRALRWDDAGSCWRVHVRGPGGDQVVTADAVVCAVGQLSRPRWPDVPGREAFGGPSWHSAAWDHTVDLRGRRVAVVGTGASAYQIVPEIAGVAGEVVVFQRNPPWLRPTPHYRQPVPEGARWLFRHLPYYAAWHRFWLFAPGLRGILEGWVVDDDHPPTERAVSALNEQLRASLVASMEAQLRDAPDLLDAVIPRYPVGAKRVLRDDGRWFETLKRDDVRLVPASVEEVTATGVRAGGEHVDVDAIVYATGFEASRFLAPMTVTGPGGVDLHERWDGQARAYLGVTVPQFPNLFLLYGPNTNLVGQGGSIVYFSECGVTYLLDAIRTLLAGGHRTITVRKDVHDRYNALVDEASARRAWGWTSVAGWYNEGGRSATNWPFSALEYWRSTRALDPTDYELA